MPQIGFRQRGFGSDVWIDKDQAADTPIVLCIHEGCGRGVAETPERDLLDFPDVRAQRVNGRRNVIGKPLESREFPPAVAHATAIEAQDRIAARCKLPGELDELAVTANPVLGAADDDDDPDPAGRIGSMQDANQRLLAAGERQSYFLAHAVSASQATVRSSVF
jgi:hypothetical protein